MESENYIKEKQLINNPRSIPLEALEILIEKMKTSICKIYCNNGGNGTGFFCNISDGWTTLKTLMTNNHILNKDDISIGQKISFSINNEKISFEIKIDETRKLYTNEKYDVTIIELKKFDELNKISFFDIDGRIFKENPDEIFRNMEIFLLHYPKGNRMEYSIGLIKNLIDFNIRHTCDSSGGSSGSPIINSINFQVIGIHKGGAEGTKNYNLGTLLKEALQDFNKTNEKEQNDNSIQNNTIENIKKVKSENVQIGKISSNQNIEKVNIRNIHKEDDKIKRIEKKIKYEYDENSPVIILDNESNILKIGLSSNNIPIYKIPSLLGFSFDEYNEEILDSKLENLNINREEVIQFRSLLQLTNPTKEWFHTNEEDIVNLLDNLLINKLGLNDLSNQKLLLTEGPQNTLYNKEKICEILFEKIGLGYFDVVAQARMNLWQLGNLTGVVLDIGDEITNIIPVDNDNLIKNNIMKVDCGGNDIINYLLRILQMNGYDVHPKADFLIGREIKNKYCFVSCDISSDRKLYEETTYYNSFYTLPDGRKIIISKEKFEAPEMLFETYNIPKLLYNTIKVSILLINI